MDRKSFLKKSLLGAAGVASSTSMVKATNVKLKESTYDKLMKQVGFNHIPNKEVKTMKTVYHKADTRGNANHGWLNSNHSFSFANYYNPERMHFGVLRVLNDDVVAGGRGFSTHPHDNMEIISIPLSGDLEHKDSMGNTAIIREGDVQVMSAGTGVFHSEYNKNENDEVKFLQIWLFPNKKNVTPRYDQITIADNMEKNELQQILSPSPEDAGVWIHQDAWFHLGKYDQDVIEHYTIKKPGNGAYFFIIEGGMEVADQNLEHRDGFGIWDTDQVELNIKKGSHILAMEVPMQV